MNHSKRFLYRCLALLVCLGFPLFASSCARATTVQPVLQIWDADESNSWATLGRLYTIIVTEEQDSDIGTIAKNNGNSIRDLLQQHIHAGAITILAIPPEQLSRQSILTLLKNLPLRAEDAVLFYFAGKSNCDRKLGQYFELSRAGEDIYRLEIHTAMANKKPRLCVLISDICDKTTAVPVPREESPTRNETPDAAPVSAKSATETNGTFPLFFSLFFMARGSIDLSSASAGQSSCHGGQYGLFTETLSGLLRENRNKVLSWQRLFPYLRESTAVSFRGSYPQGADIGEGTRQMSQTPVALYLGRQEFASPTFAKFYPAGLQNTEILTLMSLKESKLTDEGRKQVSQLLQTAISELRPMDVKELGSHENVSELDTDNTVLGMDGQPFTHRVIPMPPTAPNVAVPPAPNESNAQPDPNPAVPPAPNESNAQPDPNPAVPPTPNESNAQPDPNPAVPSTPNESNAQPEAKVRLGIQAVENGGDGVKITRVLADFPGQKAGLVVGDVIVEIDGKKITTEKEYSAAVDAAVDKITITTRNQQGKPISLTIRMR